MGQVSVISGVERRRTWSDEEKLELVAAAFAPGANVAEVSRRADVCTSLLYRWRRLMRAPAAPMAFLPSVVAEDVGSAPAAAAARAVITIVLPGGFTVSIDPDASPTLVKATLRALR
jgi:transposase